MIKAIIIDDEEMARTLLNGMIEEYVPEMQVLELCNDLPTGVKAIQKHKPDIVFLDIEMPGHSGLELLDFFNPNEHTFSIIFVTAYQQYAIQAFKLSAIDYLLKPIEAEDLIRAVRLHNSQEEKKKLAALKYNLSSRQNKKIGLSTISSIIFIELMDILFFHAEGSYTKVFLKDGRHVLASKGLKHFENTLLNNPDFFRCHKSFIVNIQHVTEYVKSEGGHLKVGEHIVGLSSEKIGEVLARLQGIANTE